VTSKTGRQGGCAMAEQVKGREPEPLTKPDFEALARFRFGIRRYLRASEEIVREHGITPQHYQLLLALMGFPGREWATVTELASLLQLRHHSVVELVNRAVKRGLVRRGDDPADARVVQVSLTAEGERLLARLSALHRDELERMEAAFALPTRARSPQPTHADDSEMPARPGPPARAPEQWREPLVPGSPTTVTKPDTCADGIGPRTETASFPQLVAQPQKKVYAASMTGLISNELIGLDMSMRAARVFAGITAESVARAGAAITLPQLRVLVLASATPALTNSAVAEALDVHLSNATRICDRLIRAGLLERRTAIADRRRVELRLTKAGEALVNTVAEHRRAAIARILSQMSTEEQDTLAGALERFADAAEEGRARSQTLL
jgi:DNA-binding MarR family transcriptional regulator